MKENNVMEILEKQMQYLKEKGYDVVFIAHQGSYNYGLEYEDSDVDSKAIVLPTFTDFVKNIEPISKTYELDDGNQVDVKDIRVMFNNFKKMNPSYIELLYSKYSIVNPEYEDLFKILIDGRDEVSSINKNLFLKAIAGMSKEKKKALCHPYPKIIDKVEKFGFDGKQLHHCIRLCEFINRYVAGENLENCYVSKLRETLINVKKNLNVNGNGYMSVETAKKLCDFFDNVTYNIKEKHITGTENINYKGISLLDDVKYNILKRKFKQELE